MKFISTIISLIFSVVVFAQVNIATQNRMWSSSGTWSNGVPSSSNTRIVIPENIEVTIKNETINLLNTNLDVFIGGKLNMERTGNGQNVSELILGPTSTIEIDGGELIAISDKSNKLSTITIDIGSSEVWDGTDGNLTNPGILNSSSINGSQVPLPVILGGMNGKVNGSQIDLIWITLSELNSEYFLLEHSSDGVKFSEIAEIEAAGNSNTMNEYSFTHATPEKGFNYYRLIQFDKDGKFEEFEPIIVEFSNKIGFDENIAIYPNPNNGEKVFVKVPENDPDNISVLINNIYQLDEVGDITFINQGENGLLIIEFEKVLQPGIYSINFLIGTESYSQKLVVK